MVRRVRALLAKAMSTEHEAEAATFEAKAQQLMARYAIEQRELRDSEEYGQSVLDFTDWGHAQYGVAALAALVAPIYGGYGVLWSVGDGKTGRAKIMATETQRTMIDVTLDHLLPQLRADILRDKPRSRKSYAIGWAQRVVDRLEDARDAAYIEVSGSTALVPSSSEAERLMREAITVSKSRTDFDGQQMNDGARAGEQADLGQEKIDA